MDNNFELPINHNGKDYLFPVTLITYGYTYQIAVTVFDTVVNFEPDEEGSFRALIKQEEIKQHNNITKELLQLIAETMQDLLR